MAMQVRRIGVVGAGLMGRAIALEFALAGYEVGIHDVRSEALERLRQGLEPAVRNLVDFGVVAEAAIRAAVERIEPHANLADAVRGADYVVEAVAEDLDVKRATFAELDRLAPSHAVFASNTSGLCPDDLAEATRRPSRVLVAHYINPPYFIPLVEVVPASATAPEVVETVVELLRGVGKQPVVQRYVPGFVANRLQFALFREAAHLIDEGVVAAEDVDTIVTAGLGPRWAALGPIRTADMAGLDVFLAIASYLF
ncbi:MAG TPA: 3-hydroxyacyl-CoA dehydrogenase family protein, partial [Chloroflexota bacterium]